MTRKTLAVAALCWFGGTAALATDEDSADDVDEVVSYTNAELDAMKTDLVQPNRTLLTENRSIHDDMQDCRASASGWVSGTYVTALHFATERRFEVAGFNQTEYLSAKCDLFVGDKDKRKFVEHRRTFEYALPKWTGAIAVTITPVD